MSMDPSALLSNLKVNWDAPFRVAASLLGMACVLTFLQVGVSPLACVADAARWLGFSDPDSVLGPVGSWLQTRSRVLDLLGFAAIVVGLTVNTGDGSGRHQLPQPWRGASTALVGFAVVWEVAPAHRVSSVVTACVVIVLRAITARVAGTWPSVGAWVGQTAVNLLGSLLYACIPLLWLFSRPSAGRTRTE